MSYAAPLLPFRASPIISAPGPYSIGYAMRSASQALADIAWGVTNQARYVPFWIPEPIVVVKLLAFNGTTLGGNSDMALYDTAGVRLIASPGAAAQAGTQNWQEFDVTDTPLLPGLYYVGLLSTSTTATFRAWNVKAAGQQSGVFSQAVGAGTMPSPATFAALDSGVIPCVGIATRTLI